MTKRARNPTGKRKNITIRNVIGTSANDAYTAKVDVIDS